MRAIGVAGLLLLSFHVAASAQEPAKDKIICKRVIQADTGSHFSNSKRVCMSALDWKLQEDETQRTLHQAKDRSSINPAVIPPGMGSTPH